MNTEATSIILEISPTILSIYDANLDKSNINISKIPIDTALDDIKAKKIRWHDIKVVLNNENSSVIPYEFSDNENAINRICSMLFAPKGPNIVITEKIHNITNGKLCIADVTFLCIIEKKLYSVLNDCFFPQKVIIKHKGNLFLNLVSRFITHKSYNGYNIFIYLEKNNFYIAIFEVLINEEEKQAPKCTLLLYNRFDFESYDKAIYYILVTLSTLKIDICKKTSINTFSLLSCLSVECEKDYMDKLEPNLFKGHSYKITINVFGDPQMDLAPFVALFKQYV